MMAARSATARPADGPDVVPVIGDEHRWRTVYRLIADQVSSGALKPGDRLQGERDLSATFGVGRATVRRALAALERDGLVESLHGRGTFVSGGPLRESNVLVGLSELAAQRGLPLTSVVIAAETVAATLEQAEVFAVAPGSPLFHLERVRLLDGLELALADSLIPASLAPEIALVDFAAASLYSELAARGARPVRAEFTVWAERADARTASLLHMEPGDPVLLTRTRASDVRHRVVETSRVAYRADRYRLETVLARRHA